MNKLFLTLSLLGLITITLCTTCRDGSVCPGNDTCCLTAHGVGCCPYFNANCCGDGVHCCPQPYQCRGIQCMRSDETNEFLAFLSSDELKATELTKPIEIMKIQGIEELIKCISEIRPVVSDIVQIINDYKKKDSEAEKQAFIQLAADAYAAGIDCSKLLHSIL